MKNLRLIQWILLLPLLVSQFSKAQIRPMGNGLKGMATCSYTYGNNVYMAVRTGRWYQPGSHQEIDTIQIVRWNGYDWAYYPKFTIRSNQPYSPAVIYAMAFYKGELYIGGDFLEIIGIPNTRGLAKFAGESGWAGLKGPIQDPSAYHAAIINTMAVYHDKLYVGGHLSYVEDLKVSNMAAWDGVSWNYVGTAPEKQGAGGPVTRFIIYKDELYTLGTIGNIGGEPIGYNIAKWNGYSWSTIPSPVSSFFQIGTTFKGNLVLATMPKDYKDAIYQWDGSGWKELTGGADNEMYRSFSTDMVEYNDKLWVAGAFQDNLGNISFLATWDGKTWSNSGLQSQYPNGWNLVQDRNYFSVFAKNSSGLCIAMPFKELFDVQDEEIKLNYACRFGWMGFISGTAYWDANMNCKFDDGEKKLAGEIIEFKPGHNYTLTDSNGNYTAYLDSGIVIASIVPRKYWTVPCAEKGFTLTVKGKTAFHNVDFTVKPPQGGITDLRLNLTGASGWRARGGFTQAYTLTCENVGSTEVKDASINLVYDVLQSNFIADIQPDFTNLGGATWHISKLDRGERFVIRFQLIPDAFSAGKTIVMVAGLDSATTARDTFPADNMDTLKQEIRTSYDPNDKQCYPAGNIKPNTRELRYHIRFQNTGNDTAYKVEVVDTLDINLPLTKIYINSASHPYELKIEGNVLRWVFNNIMLPDSTTNEPLSHGYINYSAVIKPGLAVGTEIKNTAYIYFDYQLPVQTNKTRSKIMDPEWGNNGITETSEEDAGLRVYPNPAHNRVFVQNTDIKKHRVLLIDLMGKEMTAVVLQPMQVQEIPVGLYAAGIYFLRTEEGKARKLMIAR